MKETGRTVRTPAWLKDAVFYEIYPQSYFDTNGDGIGDFQGIIEKLDYIRDLGCTALWINPCYDSPFRDAGYDVRDYKKTAARYGTNEELYRLFDEAHARGMHVLLDLVPGHTSEEHPWFRESGKAERNAFSDRYIWTDFWLSSTPGYPYIGGECERNGVYMLSFFKCQPALNYGWKNPTLPWQKALSDPACLETREAIKDVMRFWLSHGCDGFRVDMADSLAKGDDAEKSGTCEIWHDLFRIREEFPEAAFVAEWSNPGQALLGAGFDMDFYLDHPGNGYNFLLREYDGHTGNNPFAPEPGAAAEEQDAAWQTAAEKEDENAQALPECPDLSYFRKDSPAGITRFLRDYAPRLRDACAGGGYIALPTCNHDTPRASYTLSARELKIAYAVLLTLPGVPFIYYGDEIGMRYLADTPTKEGAYTRAGSRTPMQWSSGKNLGFSDGRPEDLYLPVDDGACRKTVRPAGGRACGETACPDTAQSAEIPTVEAQLSDPDSLLQTVRRLTAFRHAHRDLQADADFGVLYASETERPFVYRRGNLVCAVNPSGREACISAADMQGASVTGNPVFVIGSAGADGKQLQIGPQSFAVFAVS